MTDLVTILLPPSDGATLLAPHSSLQELPWVPAAGALKATAERLIAPRRNRRVHVRMGTIEKQVMSHEQEALAQLSI